MFEFWKATFPNGKVRDPYVSVQAKVDSGDRLPFVRATLLIQPQDWDEEESTPQSMTFRDVWCLWDTGAECSIMTGEQLDPAIKEGEDFGYASLEIQFVSRSFPPGHN